MHSTMGALRANVHPNCVEVVLCWESFMLTLPNKESDLIWIVQFPYPGVFGFQLSGRGRLDYLGIS